MARHRFGGVADYVISAGADNAATLQPNTTVTCWNQVTGGTQLTDLMDVDGVTPLAGGTVITDATGHIPEFYGPDGIRSLYIDAGDGAGPRVRTVATDVGEDLTDLENTALRTTLLATAGDLVAGGVAGLPSRLPAGGPGQMLVADPLQSAGLRWGHTWRRRDLPGVVAATALSDDVPTITVTQQSTSTITGAQSLIAPDSGPFLYLGAADFQYGTTFPDTTCYLPTSRYPHTYDSGQSNWSLEFETDADELELMYKYFSSAAYYRLSVDGRRVTDLPQPTPGITPGSRHVMKLAFPTSAAARRLRFDFAYFPFGGLYLPPGASAWKPTAQGGRLGVLGDSISDGSDQNVGAGTGTWLYKAAALLGCTDAWDQARGGTGYTVPGSWATFADRVAGDIEPYHFDRLIVWGGVNDIGVSTTAQIQSAAADLYPQLLAALPAGADLYVIGCYSSSGTPAQSIVDCDEALRTTAAAAGLPFISPITGSVYDRGGLLLDTQSPWITAENQAGFIGADGVHPTDAGHEYLARRIVEALKVLMPH